MPLAAAVARAAEAKLPFEGAVEEPGQGVRADCNGVEIKLGRPSFCAAETLAGAITHGDPEASAIAFVHGRERHVLAVRQRIRPDAATTIARLKQQGFAIEILSGDRNAAVEYVARSLGVSDFRAGVTPAAKIKRIEDL